MPESKAVLSKSLAKEIGERKTPLFLSHVIDCLTDWRLSSMIARGPIRPQS